jgi:hypothetical protein
MATKQTENINNVKKIGVIPENRYSRGDYWASHLGLVFLAFCFWFNWFIDGTKGIDEYREKKKIKNPEFVEIIIDSKIYKIVKKEEIKKIE